MANKSDRDALLALIQYQPFAAALLQQPDQFEQMAEELAFAIRRTSSADLYPLLGHLIKDGSSAVTRRVGNVFNLVGSVANGLYSEVAGAIDATSKDRLGTHLVERGERAFEVSSHAVKSGADAISSIYLQLVDQPAEAGPKLLILVLSSLVVAGGVDGDGGLPDMDIPLMGIGAHRSLFTHSILIGSALEAAVLLLTRLVLCTHKNLPYDHDLLWDSIATHSVGLLGSAGKGASIGLAYHLMMDSIVQPGTYHGIPFEMPLEAHQAAFAANSMAEAAGAQTFPDEVTLANATPEVVARHKQFRANRMTVPTSAKQWMTLSEIDILTKYGSWLKALAKRIIPPTTTAQVHFIGVADGRCIPISSHEKAWVAFKEAKVLAGLTVKTSG